MEIGRGFGSMLGVSLVLAAALAARVRADSTAPESSHGGVAPSTPAKTAAPSDPDRPSRTGLLSGPSLYETGRIGSAPQAAPTAIEPQGALGAPGEKSVEGAANEVANAEPRLAPGVVNKVILDREIDARFAGLEDCRVDVARSKRIKPNEVIATTLALRWTIRPSGEAADTAVVATSPVDLEVMDCLKAAMSSWKFTPPRGGSVRIERSFTFRPLP
jgi:hypothetical protein